MRVHVVLRTGTWTDNGRAAYRAEIVGVFAHSPVAQKEVEKPVPLVSGEGRGWMNCCTEIIPIDEDLTRPPMQFMWPGPDPGISGVYWGEGGSGYRIQAEEILKGAK